MYGPDQAGPSLHQMTGNIDIAPMPDRLGQQVRGRLQDRLGVGANPDYMLTIMLEQQTQGIGIRPDAAATQEQLIVFATFSLVDRGTGKEILTDRYRARTSYDLLLSDFATVTQREDSARRLAFELSDRIERRMALYFRNQDFRNQGFRNQGTP